MNEIGLQLYTIRDALADDNKIPEIMQLVKDAGYRSVQVYGDSETSKKLGSAAINAGLRILGSTGNFDEFFNNPNACMELHKTLGTNHIGIGGYWYKNLSDVEEFIKKANQFARTLAEEGFIFSYHNHSHEFVRYENGKTAFEMLAEKLNPEIVFVLDTYWLQHGGADIRYWIEKLKGRIEVLHLKDMKRTETGTTFAEVGQGNLWWDGIIKAAEECGVRHFVVEQDEWDKDSLECIRISSQYLHQHFIR